MKNITFIISFLAILSANTLYPMKRSADDSLESPSKTSHPRIGLENCYIHNCSSQDYNKAFATEYSLDAHMQIHQAIIPTIQVDPINFDNINPEELLLHLKQAINNQAISLDIDHIEKPAQQSSHMSGQKINTLSQKDISITEEEIFSITEEENFSETEEERLTENRAITPLLPTVITYKFHNERPISATLSTPSVPKTPLNNFVCTFEGCNKSHVSNSALIIHIRTHTKEKPHACTFEGCNKAYTQVGALTRHLRTHTGEKPFACTFEGCDKAFIQKGHLIKHIKTHQK